MIESIQTNKANSPSTGTYPSMGALSDGGYKKELTDEEKAANELKARAEDAKDKANYHKEDTTIEVWDE
jgi:hypothetical protein